MPRVKGVPANPNKKTNLKPGIDLLIMETGAVRNPLTGRKDAGFTAILGISGFENGEAVTHYYTVDPSGLTWTPGVTDEQAKIFESTAAPEDKRKTRKKKGAAE